MKRKKSIFEFEKSQKVTCLKDQKTKLITGGEQSFWDVLKKAFIYEWEKANDEPLSYREAVNNGSNGAER
ncbi:MAG: hypothetical protein AAFQ94_31485 [Bacteroidota bacterium]